MASNIFLLLISHLLIKFTEGAGLCSDFLLPTIPDSHLAASSSLNIAGSNGYTGPDRARLDTKQTTLGNTTILMGGWAPGSDNKGQYIQATFDDLTYIEKIVTQGQNPGGGYVKLYRLEYTEDGTIWQPVNMVKSSAGVEQIFRGNSDADTHVEEELDCPVFAKGIRLYPLEWESHIALRFDVKGCYLDNNALATPPPTVTTSVGTPLTTPTTSVTSTIRTTQTTPTTLPTTPTTSPTTPTIPSTTPLTTPTTPTTTPTTTPITTPRATTTPPFMPGIPTPFGLPYTTLRTVLLTSTSTTPTPMTTIPTTKSTTVSTTPVTTTASTTTSSTTKSTTTTPLTTIKSTTIPAKTFPPFLPGIQNPFGSTKQPFVVIG